MIGRVRVAMRETFGISPVPSSSAASCLLIVCLTTFALLHNTAKASRVRCTALKAPALSFASFNETPTAVLPFDSRRQRATGGVVGGTNTDSVLVGVTSRVYVYALQSNALTSTWVGLDTPGTLDGGPATAKFSQIRAMAYAPVAGSGAGTSNFTSIIIIDASQFRRVTISNRYVTTMGINGHSPVSFSPQSIVVDMQGNIYVSSTTEVYWIYPNADGFKKLVGSSASGPAFDNATWATATFHNVFALAWNDDTTRRQLLIVDRQNCQIRRINISLNASASPIVNGSFGVDRYLGSTCPAATVSRDTFSSAWNTVLTVPSSIAVNPVNPSQQYVTTMVSACQLGQFNASTGMSSLVAGTGACYAGNAVDSSGSLVLSLVDSPRGAIYAPSIDALFFIVNLGLAELYFKCVPWTVRTVTMTLVPTLSTASTGAPMTSPLTTATTSTTLTNVSVSVHSNTTTLSSSTVGATATSTVSPATTAGSTPSATAVVVLSTTVLASLNSTTPPPAGSTAITTMFAETSTASATLSTSMNGATVTLTAPPPLTFAPTTVLSVASSNVSTTTKATTTTVYVPLNTSSFAVTAAVTMVTVALPPPTTTVEPLQQASIGVSTAAVSSGLAAALVSPSAGLGALRTTIYSFECKNSSQVAGPLAYVANPFGSRIPLSAADAPIAFFVGAVLVNPVMAIVVGVFMTLVAVARYTVLPAVLPSKFVPQSFTDCLASVMAFHIFYVVMSLVWFSTMEAAAICLARGSTIVQVVTVAVSTLSLAFAVIMHSALLRKKQCHVVFVRERDSERAKLLDSLPWWLRPFLVDGEFVNYFGGHTTVLQLLPAANKHDHDDDDSGAVDDATKVQLEGAMPLLRGSTPNDRKLTELMQKTIHSTRPTESVLDHYASLLARIDASSGSLPATDSESDVGDQAAKFGFIASRIYPTSFLKLFGVILIDFKPPYYFFGAVDFFTSLGMSAGAGLVKSGIGDLCEGGAITVLVIAVIRLLLVASWQPYNIPANQYAKIATSLAEVTAAVLQLLFVMQVTSAVLHASVLVYTVMVLQGLMLINEFVITVWHFLTQRKKKSANDSAFQSQLAGRLEDVSTKEADAVDAKPSDGAAEQPLLAVVPLEASDRPPPEPAPDSPPQAIPSEKDLQPPNVALDETPVVEPRQNRPPRRAKAPDDLRDATLDWLLRMQQRVFVGADVEVPVLIPEHGVVLPSAAGGWYPLIERPSLQIAPNAQSLQSGSSFASPSREKTFAQPVRSPASRWVARGGGEPHIAGDSARAVQSHWLTPPRKSSPLLWNPSAADDDL